MQIVQWEILQTYKMQNSRNLSAFSIFVLLPGMHFSQIPILIQRIWQFLLLYTIDTAATRAFTNREFTNALHGTNGPGTNSLGTYVLITNSSVTGHTYLPILGTQNWGFLPINSS